MSKPLTVKELIDKLSEVNPEAVLYVTLCDEGEDYSTYSDVKVIGVWEPMFKGDQVELTLE